MLRCALGILIYGLAINCFLVSLGLAREIRDASQVNVTVTDHPKRIVTLAPSLSELAADVLGESLDRIVGVSEYSDYPPGLKKVPSVGPYHLFNLEKVVALKPDLVLATLDGNSKDQVQHLREVGLSVIVVSTQNISEIEESMKLVSTALGKPEVGPQMIGQLRAGLQRFRGRARLRSPVRVMLQLGDGPLIVVGRKSFLHSALETVGALNIYADADAHYPKPALEDVLSRNPDFILILALGENLVPFQFMADRWKQMSGLKAVKSHHVSVLKGDPLLRPSLRILEGLALLERSIYGSQEKKSSLGPHS